MAVSAPASPRGPEKKRAYLSSTQVLKEILGHLGQGDLESAVQLYSHCQEDIGYLLITKAPRDKKLMQNLAKMLFAAKDFEKAAQVCEAMAEYKKAAELYARCDLYDNAAELYAKLEDWEMAAQMFEKHGDYNLAAEYYSKVNNYERAAISFEKAVNHFLAGKYYFQLKKYQKSMELLQKISSGDDHYLEAALMMGNILASHGYLDLAIQKYQNVAQTVGLNQGTLGVFYNLAQLLERQKKLIEAKKTYEDIRGLDPGYRDAAQRIAALETEIMKGVEVVDASAAEAELPEEIEELQPVEEAEQEVVAMPRKPSAAAAGPPAKAQIVSVMEGFEFLKSTSLFESLSLGEMKAFWNICANLQLKAGEILIEQDQPGQALFILKKGALLVQRIEGGKAKDLVELKPGAHVGEMSLVDNAPTSARVITKEDSELFQITREKFEELLNQNDKIAIKVYQVFIATLCQRLRQTTAELSAAKKASA